MESTKVGHRSTNLLHEGCLDNSEASKVGTEELEEHVLAPSEPSVDIEHTVRQTRGEKHKHLFQIFSRQGAKEVLVASVARWEEHLRMLTVLERERLELSEAIENLCEKQELLATLMGSKKCLQKDAPERFQEQIFQASKNWSSRSYKAQELLGRKHKLGKLEKERDRARMLQGRARRQGLKWFCCGNRQLVPPFVLARPLQRMRWMKQCLRPP